LIDWKFILKKQAYRIIPVRLEPKVWKAVKNIQGTSFIDVGANLGLIYSFPLRMNFHRTYAVEPHPTAAQAIRREVRRRGIRNDAEWGNVEVEEFAASDENGTVDLFLDDTKGRCSGSGDTIEPVFHYRPASNPLIDMESIGVIRDEKYFSDESWKGHMDSQGRKAVKVKARRLDDWWGEAQIDLLKIDVEGAEFKVLRGATRILPLVKNIIIELHDRERKKELDQALGDNGFRIIWIDADHLYGYRA
jgi:FkbM family methyltransferase